MFLVLLGLVSQACLAGLTDSVMSPYLCPVVREHGEGDTLCGLIISARFATHIISILVLGQVISRIGASRMFLGSVGVCAVFNMLLASIEWIEDDDTFIALTFLFIALSMIGDSGVFCSIYVLAGKTSCSLGKSEEDSQCRSEERKKAEQINASGPAWVETLYGCGSMLGPPLGGVIAVIAGFAGVILSIGGCMAVMGCITAVAFYLERKEQNMKKLVRRLSCDPEEELNFSPSVVEQRSCDPSSELSYLSALSCPPVTLCCLLQVSSGLASSWYLSSLQKYLSIQVSLTTHQIGLVYMSQSLVYTLLTPGVGLLLDRGWPRLPFLYLGLSANTVGYLLLGPSVLLSSAQPSLAFSVPGLLLIGLGQAASLITCLNIMMSVTNGASHESNAGKITSLWECCEMVGGYLGSTLGGITTDALGFRMSTTLVSGVFVIIMMILSLFNILYLKRSKQEPTRQCSDDNVIIQ